MRRVIILSVIIIFLLFGACYGENDPKDHYTKYSLLNEIMHDSIGYTDGLFKLKNDNNLIIYICTNKHEIFETNKDIITYNKNTRRFSVKNVNYYSWSTISVEDKDKNYIDLLKNELEHQSLRYLEMDSHFNNVIHYVVNKNKSCRFSVNRIIEYNKNKEEGNNI